MAPFRTVSIHDARLPLTRPWVKAALVAVGVVVALLGAQIVAAHDGHPVKQTFDELWHYEPEGDDYDAWMTLTVGLILECDSDEDECGDKWQDPFDAAIADWNQQETTVRFEVVDDGEVDLLVRIPDTIPGEDETTLGLEVSYDINEDECGEPCAVYSALVYLADDAHIDDYGTAEERQATVTHEIGHAIGLAHESVDLPCGEDETGEVPHSIMAYNCSDPLPDGLGEILVQPWDVCGINHLYFDPTIGFAGCEVDETPTATPALTSTPEPTTTPPPTATPAPTGTGAPTETPAPTGAAGDLAWSDADCDGELSSRDNQALLRNVLSQAALSQTEPCPDIGDGVSVGGFGDTQWGDADCDGELSSRDNQALLRFVLSQAALSQTEPCADIGDEVAVS